MVKIDIAIMMTDGLVNSPLIDDITVQDERRGGIQYFSSWVWENSIILFKDTCSNFLIVVVVIVIVIDDVRTTTAKA